MSDERLNEALRGAAAYEIVDRASDYGKEVTLTKELAELVKRLVDESDFRCVSLDVWGAVFDGQDADMRRAWLSYMTELTQCNHSPDECSVTADTRLTSKN